MYYPRIFQAITAASLLTLLAASPQSSTYLLESYGVGSGGAVNSTSTTYQASVISGEQGNAGGSAGSTDTAGTGLIPTRQAHVPSAPAFTNPASYYNKLHIIINNGGNPTDATFAIAISPDAFASTTNYVQSDQTVGATLHTADLLTYAGWGSGTGVDIIGLLPNTTYTVKVKAQHGAFTDSAYSATAAAATVSPSISFDIDASATNLSTNPPYAVNFTGLVPNTVIDSTEKIWVSLDTNAQSGGKVFISSLHSGLQSIAASKTIASATADLALASEGFGGQSASVAQTSGGPLAASSPYASSTQNVGLFDTTIRPLYTSSGPIVGGRGQLQLKARATSSTPAGQDYNDTLTLIASGSF